LIDRLAGDRRNLRAYFLPLSGLILAVVHALLGFTDANPIVPLALLGVAYSVFAATLWPMIPALVGTQLLGTAYGISTVALNIALTFVPLIVARLITEKDGKRAYTSASLFFVLLSLTAFVLSLVITWLDVRDRRREEGEGEEDQEYGVVVHPRRSRSAPPRRRVRLNYDNVDIQVIYNLYLNLLLFTGDG
jgi:MFS family permease